MDLSKLKVSNTKHGAHKLAILLRKFPAEEVLDHVYDTALGIDINDVQVKKHLSVDSRGKAPALWNTARTLGDEAIDALVLVAIIFSHHEHIRAMAAGRSGPFRGTVIRGDILKLTKAYTNFAGTLDVLGFSPLHTQNEVQYDLRPMFAIDGLGPLALDLLKRKLRTAGWNETSDAIDEMVAHRFHDSLAISESQFRSWLTAGTARSTLGDPKDEAFFTGADEAPTRDFEFRAGHTPRKTGTVSRRATPEERKASLLHNEIQTALYKHLVKEHGEDAVGTEVPTGLGTSIDVVVRANGECTFYEIKIADTLRACIRQALPQLMEYAYWRCSDLSQRLVIVGTFAKTPEADAYLKYLRRRFQLPVYYVRFRLKRSA
jgi:hypothetical protein